MNARGFERGRNRVEGAPEQRVQIERNVLDRLGARAVEHAADDALDAFDLRADGFEHVPLDLNALLRRIFDATAPTLEASGVRLTTALAEGLPPVAGDADRLQQVFINLFNNALDAMRAGGELRVETAREASAVRVDFSDTGTGMTEEVRAHIFDPLYTTKERGRGTGLGLVVVRQVVQEHGGRIEVESAPGQGARFRLTFPASAEDFKSL